MVEIIKENQYRILFVLLSLVYIGGLLYALIYVNLVNPIEKVTFFKNPLNYIIVGAGYLNYKIVKPYITAIWTQFDVRDNIEKQTAIKLELENEKLRLELEEMKRRLK